MKRRAFIFAAVATTVAVAIPGVYYSFRRKKAGDKLTMPYVLQGFCSEEEIYTIGTRYLAKEPSENTKEVLTSLLLTTSTGVKLSATNKQAIAELLQKKIQEEFATYKTIIVNGWVITATEARQCALFSLTHN